MITDDDEVIFEPAFEIEEEDNKVEIKFAPGCFDDFEGTQEELDDLIAALQAMAESGELQENSIPLEDDEDIEYILNLDKRDLH